MTQPSDEIVERVARAMSEEGCAANWEHALAIARAAIAATGLVEEVERLRGLLEPFAFLEMEKDEGLADTQYVWEAIHRDRVKDWFDYNDIAAARQALAEKPDATD